MYLKVVLHCMRNSIQHPEIVHILFNIWSRNQRVLKIQGKMTLRDNLVKPLHFINKRDLE